MFHSDQPPSTKVFSLSPCKRCGLKFQPVDWLAFRVAGYCKAKCRDEAERDRLTLFNFARASAANAPAAQLFQKGGAA